MKAKMIRNTDSSPPEKHKILCVDDESSVLDSLQRILRKDFDVSLASSAEEALKLFNQDPHFSIVISDFRMPGMNGLDFLKQIQKISPNTIRVILSGQIDTLHISRAINESIIHRFFLKPWDNEYLRVQIFEALQSFQHLRENEHLRKLSITDPITQLTNHRYFQEMLKLAFQNAKQDSSVVSLIMLDVDYFKSFNDRYGHPEGDRLLCSIAERLKQFQSKVDNISRYGGEEFAIIASHKNSLESFQIAESLRKSFEENPFVGPHGHPSYITVSLGVADSSICKTCQELIDFADKALYEAKKQGRNKTVIQTVNEFRIDPPKSGHSL